MRLPGPIDSTNLAPEFMDLIGWRFIAHLPPRAFSVKVSDLADPVFRDLASVEVYDEPYMLELSPGTKVILNSRCTGIAPEYYWRDWADDDPRPVMTMAQRGQGSVIYLSLGHLQGRFGLRPFKDEADIVRRSWPAPAFLAPLRRLFGWGCGATT